MYIFNTYIYINRYRYIQMYLYCCRYIHFKYIFVTYKYLLFSSYKEFTYLPNNLSPTKEFIPLELKLNFAPIDSLPLIDIQLHIQHSFSYIIPQLFPCFRLYMIGIRYLMKPLMHFKRKV